VCASVFNLYSVLQSRTGLGEPNLRVAEQKIFSKKKIVRRYLPIYREIIIIKNTLFV